MTSDTSAEALASVAPSTSALRTTILKRLAARACTADEMAGRLEETVLTIRPRFTELRQAGLIRDTGERRKNISGRNAAVWAITEDAPA